MTPRLRAFLLQLLFAAALLALAGWALANLLHNLAARDISVGFGYLWHEAGFDIAESLIDYDASRSYGRAFLVGLCNTLAVSSLAIVCASLLGLALGIARLSPNWLAARLAGLYIETVRNVPLLLQLLLWYGMLTELLPAVEDAWRIGPAWLSQRGLALPWLVDGSLSWPQPGAFGFEGGKTISPEFAALAFGLSVYAAAFIAEIVRGGILAVPRAQVDAAAALGMSRAQALRHVILPQAMRVIVPPLTSQYLNLLKNSSLAVAIGYPDLVSVSTTTLNQTGQAIEAMLMMMAVYLAISLAIAAGMNWHNRRVQFVGR